jgi:hypothetical protein
VIAGKSSGCHSLAGLANLPLMALKASALPMPVVTVKAARKSPSSSTRVGSSQAAASITHSPPISAAVPRIALSSFSRLSMNGWSDCSTPLAV